MTGAQAMIQRFKTATKLPLVEFETGAKLRDIERIVILETLKDQNFNRTHAARVLGIGIRTLQRKLKKYGLADIGLKEFSSTDVTELFSQQLSNALSIETQSLSTG